MLHACAGWLPAPGGVRCLCGGASCHGSVGAQTADRIPRRFCGDIASAVGPRGPKAAGWKGCPCLARSRVSRRNSHACGRRNARPLRRCRRPSRCHSTPNCGRTASGYLTRPHAVAAQVTAKGRKPGKATLAAREAAQRLDQMEDTLSAMRCAGRIALS